jgi:hypothetical protein
MRRCALVALGLVLAGSSLFTATASASGSRDHDSVHQIIRDCARDGDLDRTYPLRALRRALDQLPWHVRRHTRCERKLERAIDRARRDLDREVGKIWRDCSRDDDLDRHYSLRALRRALRRLPMDLRDYTDCAGAIRRAIRRARGPIDREVHKIWRDCGRDDDLDRHYSLRALRRALRRLPDDLRDYTDCEKAIRRAIRRAEKDHDDHGHGHGHGKDRGHHHGHGHGKDRGDHHGHGKPRGHRAS